MTLLLLGLLLLIHIYLSSKISFALRQLGFNHLKFLTLFIPVYFLSYPLIGLFGFLLSSQAIISTFRFGNKIFDAIFTYPFWVGLVFALQTFFPLLLIDIARLILKSTALALNQVKLNIIFPWLIILTAVVNLIYAGVKTYIDTNKINISTATLKVDNLPGILNGFKIVHISDIQADERTGREKIERYINIVNSLEPDIVIFTGDIVTYGTKHIPLAVEMISKVNSKFGVYSCIGDHDYWAGVENINTEMAKYGLKLFDNENVKLKIDGATLGLTFVTNIYSERPQMDILENLASSNDADIKIFVTHQPSESLVKFAKERNYKLFLSGHTHGGQVVISLFGFEIIPSRIETKFVSGFYDLGSILVSVNRGLGFTAAPIRFNAPAEVTLIKLAPGS
jgi:predicted MPP superfamily phosphohydrolase